MRAALLACLAVDRAAARAHVFTHRGANASAAAWHAPIASSRAAQNCSRFVVITSQRSGSRYFIDKLKSHTEIRTAGEIFSHDRFRNTTWSSMHDAIDRHMGSACSYNEHVTTVGFKWMLNQGHDDRHEKVKNYFRKSGTKLVFLWRKNEVRRIISLRALATEKEAHPSAVQAAQLAAEKIAMPSGRALINQLEKDAHERKSVTRYYERSSDHLVIFYEDIVESSPKYGETFKRVFYFVGVAPTQLTASRSIAIHGNQPMLASVSNAEAVLQTLILCCACTPEKADGVLKRAPRNYAHPCCSVTAALCDDVEQE